RGLYNAGHRRGAVAGRCVVRGKTVETEEIPAFCALALAGLGWLPDTILSRSIIIRMRRRAPGETVTPFRRRVHAPAGHELRDQLTIWAAQVPDTMSAARPEMPPGIEDAPPTCGSRCSRSPTQPAATGRSAPGKRPPSLLGLLRKPSRASE